MRRGYAKAGRLAHYRRFVYEKGGLSFRSSKGEVVNASAVFRSRIRYFIDGGMIGTLGNPEPLNP